MQEDIRVLTFTHIGDTAEEDGRMTLSPMNIKLLVAYDAVKQNRAVKRVTILFLEGDTTEIFVSDMDLLTIERAVGIYGNMC